MNLETAKTTLLAPFDLETAKLERVFGTLARAQGRLRRPLLPVLALRGLEPGGGHRQVGQLQHRAGRRRARRLGREDRLRLFRRDQLRTRCRTRAKATRAIAAAGQGKTRQAQRVEPAGRRSTARIDPLASLPSHGTRSRCSRGSKRMPRARPAHHAGDGEPRRRIRGGADRARRRHARRRRAPAGAPVGAGDRRAERPARERARAAAAAAPTTRTSPTRCSTSTRARRCRRRSSTSRRGRRRPAP